MPPANPARFSSLENGQTRQQHLDGKQPHDRAVEQRGGTVGARPAQRIKKAIEAEGDAEVGEASVAIAFADARAMPPSALSLRVHRHEIGRANDRELIGGEAHGRRGRRSGVFEEGAQLADGAELHRDAEAIGVAAMLGDKRAIGIVEMKVPGELIGGGLARETSVVACLAVGEKTDRHCSFRPVASLARA